jgi:hypothetical protein
VAVFEHFMVVAAALVGISGGDKLGKRFEHFALPSGLFLDKFILVFF